MVDLELPHPDPPVVLEVIRQPQVFDKPQTIHKTGLFSGDAKVQEVLQFGPVQMATHQQVGSGEFKAPAIFPVVDVWILQSTQRIRAVGMDKPELHQGPQLHGKFAIF